MSHFILKSQPSRKKFKGIWLRYRNNPDVLEAIKKSHLKRTTEVIEWVSICELRPENEVMLEVWCHSLPDYIRKKSRHNVFHIIMKENPEWICEGDLGRGLA